MLLRFCDSEIDYMRLQLQHELYCFLSCIRIRTRGGIYGKIWPEQSQGLRPYFTVHPDLSPNTDIIQFLTMIY